MSEHIEQESSERTASFPFSEWLAMVEGAGERLSGRARHCSRSAFVHLRKAWQLHGVDDEMSFFRAITAEEEAATALILSLQQRHYAGAERLKHNNHDHKSAFWPLIEAVNRFLIASGMAAPNFALSKTGRPKVALKLNIAAMIGSKEPLWGEPDHPLNFVIRSGDAPEKMVHTFDAELEKLAGERGAGTMKSHIKNEANVRNRLLYATDTGYPTVSFSDDLLIARAHRVGILLLLTVIVLQTPVHQLFVTQCLEALLRALAIIGDVKFDYSASAPPQDQQVLTILRNAEGESTTALRRRVSVAAVWGTPQYTPTFQYEQHVSSIRFAVQ